MQSYINQVHRMGSLVEYSKDAIVSKIIYKNDHTILTLFALDQGQSIAEHVTPFDAMVQVLDGEAEIVIGGVKNIVLAGESIIMPTNIPHSLLASVSFKMLLVMMK